MTPIESSLQTYYASRVESEVANFDYEYVLNGYNELIGYQLRVLDLRIKSLLVVSPLVEVLMTTRMF